MIPGRILFINNGLMTTIRLTHCRSYLLDREIVSKSVNGFIPCVLRHYLSITPIIIIYHHCVLLTIIKIRNIPTTIGPKIVCICIFLLVQKVADLYKNLFHNLTTLYMKFYFAYLLALLHF